MKVLIDGYGDLVVGSFEFNFEVLVFSTYDSTDNCLSYINGSSGCWHKSTYNSSGLQLSYSDSTGKYLTL